MADEMFFTADRRALRRGRRVSARTETCRPCLVWLKDAPEDRYPGVVMDINPQGMCIRMVEALPQNSDVVVQMMRDDEFKEPLAEPLEVHVARVEAGTDGFIDHGMRIVHKDISSLSPSKTTRVHRYPHLARRTQIILTNASTRKRREGRIGR